MPPRRIQHPILQFLSGPNSGTQVILDQAVTPVGREAPNSILRLHDMEVSREHTVILFEADSYMIMDRNSRNGTYLNGVRLDTRKHVLNDGDVIDIHSYRLVFKTDLSTVGVDYVPRQIVAAPPLPEEDFTVSMAAGDALVRGVPIGATPTEYALLEYMYDEFDSFRLFPQLKAHINEFESIADTGNGTIHTHMNNIKNKLNKFTDPPVKIVNRWGRGYKLARMEDETEDELE